MPFLAPANWLDVLSQVAMLGERSAVIEDPLRLAGAEAVGAEMHLPALVERHVRQVGRGNRRCPHFHRSVRLLP